MSFIPKLAKELQSFESIEEMNRHMDLHYLALKDILTDSFDRVFHVLKKYSCKAAGVCWLKQDNLAAQAEVSTKTVERTLKLLKDTGVLKIYHTKRGNGLNGNCYYVLQPYTGELLMDDEEIVEVEEGGNVGAVEFLANYAIPAFNLNQINEKLFKSSFKTLQSSLKHLEEDYSDSARVQSNIINPLNLDNTLYAYEAIIEHLVENNFSHNAATEIVAKVVQSNRIEPLKLLVACAKALNKFRKRLTLKKPIESVVAYLVCLIHKEIEPDFVYSSPKTKTIEVTRKPIFYNWLEN